MISRGSPEAMACGRPGPRSERGTGRIPRKYRHDAGCHRRDTNWRERDQNPHGVEEADRQERGHPPGEIRRHAAAQDTAGVPPPDAGSSVLLAGADPTTVGTRPLPLWAAALGIDRSYARRIISLTTLARTSLKRSSRGGNRVDFRSRGSRSGCRWSGSSSGNYSAPPSQKSGRCCLPDKFRPRCQTLSCSSEPKPKPQRTEVAVRRRQRVRR